MNNISIVGRLTRDPELRQAGSVTVCNFCVAVERRTKDGENAADFIDCSAFGKTAEFLCKWFTKGKKIGIEGALHSHSWTGDDGKAHKRLEVQARQLFFIESRASEGGAVSPERQRQRPAQSDTLPEAFEAIEDDVPF